MLLSILLRFPDVPTSPKNADGPHKHLAQQCTPMILQSNLAFAISAGVYSFSLEFTRMLHWHSELQQLSKTSAPTLSRHITSLGPWEFHLINSSNFIPELHSIKLLNYNILLFSCSTTSHQWSIWWNSGSTIFRDPSPTTNPSTLLLQTQKLFWDVTYIHIYKRGCQKNVYTF